jgi:hypothetical protein
MKVLLLFLFLSTFVQAHFSKPQLIARLSDRKAWNAPLNTWCFSGEPAAFKGSVYLNCADSSGDVMASWKNGVMSIEARAELSHLFSKPISRSGKISWYEFNEVSIPRSYLAADEVQKIEIENLSTFSDPVDSFMPLNEGEFFFKSSGLTPKLWSWKHNEVTPFFEPQSAYIFTPQAGPFGEIVVKTRELHLSENAPDRLWHFSGQWRVVFEDTDANPLSRWKSFRHQLSVEGDKILLIANDGDADHLLLIEQGREQVLAIQGVDLKSFDYFLPKLRSGVAVVRGEDFEGRKAVYASSNGRFKKVISEGDLVQTDLGSGVVYYPQKDSIFYGAPGIDESGNVYLQATLSDFDHPQTFLGIGLLKLQKN